MNDIFTFKLIESYTIIDIINNIDCKAFNPDTTLRCNFSTTATATEIFLTINVGNGLPNIDITFNIDSEKRAVFVKLHLYRVITVGLNENAVYTEEELFTEVTFSIAAFGHMDKEFNEFILNRNKYYDIISEYLKTYNIRIKPME